MMLYFLLYLAVGFVALFLAALLDVNTEEGGSFQETVEKLSKTPDFATADETEIATVLFIVLIMMFIFWPYYVMKWTLE